MPRWVCTALAFLARSQPLSAGTAGDMLWGDCLGLMAGMAWGATTVVIRTSRLTRAPAAQTMLYQLVGAFVLLSIASVLLGQTAFNPTRLALGNLVFQSLVVSFASFLAWFWLLRHHVSSQLGVLSFMTPLFGVAFGMWLLQEPLESSFVAGAAMALSGIVLVSGHGWVRGQILRRA